MYNLLPRLVDENPISQVPVEPTLEKKIKWLLMFHQVLSNHYTGNLNARFERAMCKIPLTNQNKGQRNKLNVKELMMKKQYLCSLW